MDHFDPCNVFLAIATNIPQRLKTGFVVQGNILLFLLGVQAQNLLKLYCICTVLPVIIFLP